MDTQTIWDQTNNRGDWALNGTQLQTGEDLATAVLISLFTDRVAQDSDVIPDGTTNPRGWIGDVGQKYQIGSRLWLLDRAKQTTQNLQRARTYVTEAVQWLIDDGVVARFDLTVEWTKPGMLGIWIVAHKPNGQSQSMTYSWVWNGIT